MIDTKFPSWAPAYMVEWLRRPDRKLPENLEPVVLRLLTDGRMQSVWTWFDAVVAPMPDAPVSRSFSLCFDAARATMSMPTKPGNLSPAERERYFINVRKNADALIKLLEGTIYDHGMALGKLIKAGDMASEVHRWLRPVPDDDDDPWPDQLVAYNVTPDGVYRLPFPYPEVHLVKQLHELIDWTYWDDNWDWQVGSSSEPVRQARGTTARVIYFNCTLYRQMRSTGVILPFPVLATIANVALELSDQDAVDEEAVRKQVRRYEKRLQGREHVGADQDSGEDAQH